MCGITGFADYQNSSSETILLAMVNTLYHRGPDDGGHVLWQENDYQVGFAHKRLSIIDLSPFGKQPMSYNQFTIVFNGEIYNYLEIRKELESFGHQFKSHSDTEVILHAISEWGIGAVDKFIGMFAFAVYDKKKRELNLFRDRAGVKPLYYYSKPGGLFLFASELKSFHQHPAFQKEIDKDALALYFQYGYIPVPHCIFRDTYKLRQGHYLHFDLETRQLKEICYWDVFDFYNKPTLNISFDEAKQETKSLLKSSFNYRMISDVPVGVFLSGGYDSTAVAALLQEERTEKLRTFTIGFKNAAYDEAPSAKKVAQYLGTDHTEYYCTEKDAREIVPELPEIYDEPFADSSAIPTILVSRLAKQEVSVALSADGGDELFAGYTKYINALRNYRTLRFIPAFLQSAAGNAMKYTAPLFSPFANKINRFVHKYQTVRKLMQKGNHPVLVMKYMSQRFDDEELSKLFLRKVGEIPTYFDTYDMLESDDLLAMLQAVDYKTYLMDDILTKVDRATMSVSLEGREPFLDHRIIEFVAQLPSDFKLKNGQSKYLLKEIVHDYVPKEMMERPKQGFAVPVIDWFRRDLRPLLLDHISKDTLSRDDIFNVDYVISKRDGYLEGSNDHWEFIWFMMVFRMWFNKWIK